jgi:LysM repeat protein
MITYTVKSGDQLSKIAYRYQTTVAIIKGDNSIIRDINVIQVGWKLKVRTSAEYARDKTAAAKAAATKSAAAKKKTSPSSPNLAPKAPLITYQGVVISAGQIGTMTALRNTSIYTFDSKGNLKKLRSIKKGERYKVYSSIDKHGGLYAIGGAYIKRGDASFQLLPTEVRAGRGDAILVDAGNNAIPPKTSELSPKDFKIPQFSMPGYRRTRMQVKKTDGQLLSMELRLLAVTSSYSNQYTPTRTNAGWAIHTGGKNLTVLNLNGFMLDSSANREVDGFLSHYHAHLTPKSNDKYFDSQIISILHKNREYKGLIMSLNVADQSDSPVDRKFSMQFLVLTEKALSSGEITKKYKFTVARGNLTEEAFYSDLKNMLTNPITGVYNTHS